MEIVVTKSKKKTGTKKLKLQCDNCSRIFLRYNRRSDTTKEHHFCNNICSSRNSTTIAKRKATNRALYGFENPMDSAQLKDKIKKTCLEKYGVENAM